MPRTAVEATRLRILNWLKEPDVAEHGATPDAVATRFALPPAVARTHLRLLTAIGLLRAVPCGGRTCYRRDEVRIAEVARMFEKGW
ncbi:ArsR/SmtB family transcription factor [Streptomyces sp. NPDC007904]|jgi:ArsR family transcriptional regulator|uniref:ArsR/SmtB family transcription factor n=1 Tax=Streptomyces sp. NPDC007904 TaxID=3364787 RepID=UPI0036E74719